MALKSFILNSSVLVILPVVRKSSSIIPMIIIYNLYVQNAIHGWSVSSTLHHTCACFVLIAEYRSSSLHRCCATISCWMTHPLNHYLGRKKTIFITCMISFLTCIWSGLTNTWWHLFIARFFLGFGIGPKSATVPVYTAECSPAPIRGALVMMWQMWTAFGIALGDLIDLTFYFIPDTPGVTGLNWRLMLGSAGIPGLIVCMQVLFAPESPRWLISKGRYEDAFNELCRLRFSRVQAARDLYYIHVLLEAENEMKKGRNRVVEMFTIPRNRHAALASWVVMFGQQFCGVNVIGMRFVFMI